MNNFKITPFKKIIDITDIPNRDYYKNIHLNVQSKNSFFYCITNETGLTNEIKYQKTNGNQLNKTIPQSINNESMFLILKSSNNEILEALISISGKDLKPSKQWKWIFQYFSIYNICLLLLCSFFIYYLTTLFCNSSSKKSFEKGPILSYITPPTNGQSSPNITVNPISDI